MIASDQKLSQLERECQKLRVSRNDVTVSSTESDLLNRSFLRPNNAAKQSWNSELKRAHAVMRASPDSFSDYSPTKGCVRLNQEGQNFNPPFIQKRGSPFRFVPVNSINQDSKKDTTSKAFQFEFGNDYLLL